MLARGLKERVQTSYPRRAGSFKRGRLVRKVLVESMLLALVGGILGIGVAYAGTTRLMLRLAFRGGGPNNYVPIDAAPSWPILLFTLVVSGADRSGFRDRSCVDDFPYRSGGSVARDRPCHRRRTLVGAEVIGRRSDRSVGRLAVCSRPPGAAALSNLEHQEFSDSKPATGISRGINPMLGNYKPEQMEPMFRQIDDRLLQIPGMRMVAPALYAPMTGDSWNDGVRIEGRPEPARQGRHRSAGWTRVTPGFFDAIGAKVMLGRPLAEQDTGATRKVAVVNQAFAKRFFKGENPIGQHFGPDKMKYSATYEIVGVVNDIRYMTCRATVRTGAAHVLDTGSAGRDVRRRGLPLAVTSGPTIYTISCCGLRAARPEWRSGCGRPSLVSIRTSCSTEWTPIPRWWPEISNSKT